MKNCLLFVLSVYFSIIAALFSVSVVSAQTHTPHPTTTQPVPTDVTIRSVRTGDWTTANTWDLNRVPIEGDKVLIAPGHVVTYNSNSTVVLGTTDSTNPLSGALHIQGTLKFSRTQPTILKLRNNLIVYDKGYLDMGVPSDPIPAAVNSVPLTATITFVLTPEQANAFKGGHGFMLTDVGLWVFAGGRWEVHGAPIKRTWSKLAQTALANTTKIIVEHNVDDWKVGDTIILSSTGTDTGSNPISATDLRTITKSSLVEGKREFELHSPLQFSHLGTNDLKGEVALLSRNVVISTELIGGTISAYTNDVRLRKFAHTVYLEGAKGNLQYVLFKHMGHYGKLGRYATHHHIMHNSSRGAIVRGTAGWENGFRCVNLHTSHGITVEDNVCYRSSSTAYLMESASERRPDPENPGGHITLKIPPQDTAFIHNIAIATLPKHFNDRNTDSISGEPRRVASFWPGQNTDNEAYLGNVVAGGGSTSDQGGFHFPEGGNEMTELDSDGSIPFTFVMNESHSSKGSGIHTWQNVSSVRDLVGTKLWRNGTSGIEWGAYSAPFRYYNTHLKENSTAVAITSVSPFIQDSIIEGKGATVSSTGIHFNGYVQAQSTNPVSWIVRTQFKNINGNGIGQAQKVLVNPEQIPDVECGEHDFSDSLDDGISLKERPNFPAECAAVYITQMGNKFTGVKAPLQFGSQPNPNSYWKIHDHIQDASPAASFVLVREDQNRVDRQGVVQRKLVNSQATYDPSFRALRMPMNSIPQTIDYIGLLNWRSANNPDHQSRSSKADFQFYTTKDYPPTISITKESLGAKKYKITANAADDKGVTRVEFRLDWKLIATDTTAPYETTIDLANHPNKYAYIYARAFDGTKPFEVKISGGSGSSYEQRAYSNIFELGPEELGMGTIPNPTGSTDKPGDTNSDGFVNLTDLSTLLANFGRAGDRTKGDFDSNNLVNLTDLSTLLSNFGK